MQLYLQALARNATDAMKVSRVPDILHAVSLSTCFQNCFLTYLYMGLQC